MKKFLVLARFQLVYAVWEHAHTTLMNTGATQPIAHVTSSVAHARAYVTEPRAHAQLGWRYGTALRGYVRYSCAPTYAPTVGPTLAQCGFRTARADSSPQGTSRAPPSCP